MTSPRSYDDTDRHLRHLNQRPTHGKTNTIANRSNGAANTDRPLQTLESPSTGLLWIPSAW
jgi:hypothetical protein